MAVFQLVGVWRLELQASASRTQRATNCATPRYEVLCKSLFSLTHSNNYYTIVPEKWKSFFANFYVFLEMRDEEGIPAAGRPGCFCLLPAAGAFFDIYRTSRRWIPLSRPSSVSSNMGISLPTS